VTVTSPTATQLAIPGALVLVTVPDSGAPVTDRAGWQRAVLRAGLPSAAKLVALALGSHVAPAEPGADPSVPPGAAVCAPGLPVLVEETGYSRTHVQRQLSRLRAQGWLVGLGRPAAGRPARFALSVPASWAGSADNRAALATGMPPAGTPGAPPVGPPSGADRPVGRPADAGRPTGRRPGRRSSAPSAAARRRARLTGSAMSKAMSMTPGGAAVTSLPTPVPPSASMGPAEAGVPRPADGPPTEGGYVDFPAGSRDAAARIPASGPAGGALAGSVDPVVEAVEQVLATLARAMRRPADEFSGLGGRLAGILGEGGWSAAALATHLVDIIAGGVMVGGDSPADSLGWRLDHLPRTTGECPCRSCRSWRSAAPAAAAVPSAPTTPASQPPAAIPPELSAIEQAAAAGAAHARLHRAS
jgi:hypothetical protein